VGNPANLGSSKPETGLKKLEPLIFNSFFIIFR
jgi:hypothetical protein